MSYEEGRIVQNKPRKNGQPSRGGNISLHGLSSIQYTSLFGCMEVTCAGAERLRRQDVSVNWNWRR